MSQRGDGRGRPVPRTMLRQRELDSSPLFSFSTNKPDPFVFPLFFPSVEEDKLVFSILGRKSKAMSKAVYGVYHGRLIEMLLTHFDTSFSRASASALPEGDDRVGSSS